MTIIYGVDTSCPVTPTQVRDALSECFYQAHNQQTGLPLNNNSMNIKYCKQIITNAFDLTGGDFQSPSKENLIKVIKYLMDFSTTLRNPELIRQHADEIQTLINLLP